MTDASFDDDLFRALGSVVARDAVPPEVVDAAKAVFTWRTIDAELAALAFDSAVDGELTGARGSAAGPRALTFEYGAISIELDVEGDGDDPTAPRTVSGMVVPVPRGEVELFHVDRAEPWPATCDELGRFTVSGVPRGSVRLLIRFAPADGPAMLLTEWVTI